MNAFQNAGDPRTRRNIVLIAVVLVLLVSAGLRFWQLGQRYPGHYRGHRHSLIFDEIYYAPDAQAILHGHLGPTNKYFPWEPGQEISWPHPEWGKIAIAGGMIVFGENRFGRRAAAALCGLLLLACIYPIARRLGLKPIWALAALILAAADPLGLAQSRIATLDIFVAFWSVLCLYLTLRYVQDGHRARWLWLAGLAGGFAFGSKWSGGLACAAALALVALFRVRSAKAAPVKEVQSGEAPLEKAQTEEAQLTEAPSIVQLGDAVLDDIEFDDARLGGLGKLGSMVLRVLPPLAAFIVVPVAVYVASYVFYFAAGHSWSQWWEMQNQMWGFNLGLKTPHTYASKAPTWIYIGRPVWYYFGNYGGRYHGVVAIGNPLLWWPSIGALFALLLAAVRRRQWLPALPALLVAFLYLPWFAVSRTSFLYYMTPVAPFLAIAVAVALALIAGEYDGAAAGWTWSAAPVLNVGAAEERDRIESATRSGAAAVGVDAGTAPDAEAILGAGETPSDEKTIGASRLKRVARAPVVLLVAAALVTIFVWEPLETLLANLFKNVSATTTQRVAWLALAVAVGAILGAGFWLCLPGRPRPVWRAVGWLYVGIVVGIFIVFLPVIIDIGITPSHYYHLMWSSRWI